MATTENSVLVALGELKQLETDRIAEQHRSAEAKRAEEDRRRRDDELAARRQAEIDRARAETEARLRVEAEVSRDRSLDDLRARVAAVAAERAALESELRARVERAGAPAQSSRPWALAFGLSSLVAATLAGALVVQQGALSPHAADPIVIERIVVAPAVEPAPEIAEIEAAAPVVEAAPEPVREARARPPRGARTTPRPTTTDREREADDDIARDLGFGDEDDDVIGGIETRSRH